MDVAPPQSTVPASWPDEPVLTPDELDEVLSRVSRARVAVFGDFALDAYWDLAADTTETSLETGQPVRQVRGQRYSLGGAGNVAANLAAMGVVAVRGIGLLGADPFGDALLSRLVGLGIDTAGMLRIQDEWQTPVFAKPHVGGSEQGRIDFGAFNEVSAASADRLAAAVESAAAVCDVVILNQQIQAGLSPPPVIDRLNRVIATAHGCRFLVDSRHRPERYQGAMLKLNEAEAMRMNPDVTGGIDALARALSARIDRPVFLTRGGAGIITATDAGVHCVNAVTVSSPTDTVGAGDTAVAAIAAALAGGATELTATRLANLAAAVTIQKLRITGTATPDEMREFATR